MNRLRFKTALGICEIGWDDAGIARFSLPSNNAELAADDIPSELPAAVKLAIDLARKHLAGDMQDFTGIPLHWELVTEFQRSVYRETVAIRPGETKSYGEIARALGLGSAAARAVGVALGSNPWPLLVPCHRVVAANGKMTGFSAPGGISTKTRLLALEGAELRLE